MNERKWWAKRVFGGLVVLAFTWSGAASGADDYVGAQQCATCHPFEYDVWSQGPHARAHQLLSNEQSRDLKCSSCHSTAPDRLLAGASGGDEGAVIYSMTAPTTQVDLSGVQCERCHGPGRYYKESYVMRDRELARALGLVEVGGQQCQQCHTEAAPSILPFDFARLWGRISHGREARQAWQEARDARAQIVK